VMKWLTTVEKVTKPCVGSNSLGYTFKTCHGEVTCSYVSAVTLWIVPRQGYLVLVSFSFTILFVPITAMHWPFFGKIVASLTTVSFACNFQDWGCVILHEIDFLLKICWSIPCLHPSRRVLTWILTCASLNHRKKMKAERSRLIPR